MAYLSIVQRVAMMASSINNWTTRLNLMAAIWFLPFLAIKHPNIVAEVVFFLKPRRFRGGIVKAKVRFEDDYSIGHVELNDLVRYDEDAPVKSSDKRPLKDEAKPSGPLSDIIRQLKSHGV